MDPLIQLALETRQRAYAPYSNFLVGAAVECENGSMFAGCNVENASYGLAICAERVALTTAVAAGQQKFRRIVVTASPQAAPCGACRQFIAQFGSHIQVICVDATEPQQQQSWTIAELLPQSFCWPAGSSSPIDLKDHQDDSSSG